MAKTKLNTQQSKEAPAETVVKAEVKAETNYSYEIELGLLCFGKITDKELIKVEASDEATAFDKANAIKSKKHKDLIEGSGAQIVYTGNFTIK